MRKCLFGLLTTLVFCLIFLPGTAEAADLPPRPVPLPEGLTLPEELENPRLLLLIKPCPAVQ